MAELRLCPCCGGKARAKTFVSGRLKKKKFFYNECSVCGVRTGLYAAKHEADEAWNRRAEAGVGKTVRGAWVAQKSDVDVEYTCSLCGFVYCEGDPKFLPFSYCPSCGARMDSEKEARHDG